MIEKERQNRQKLTPTAAVYRPPAARIAESRRSIDSVRSSDSKQNRIRRPDQQMYVPRPKRASYGNEQPRSRSRSSSRSRTSFESDSCEKQNKCSSITGDEPKIPEPERVKEFTPEKDKTLCNSTESTQKENNDVLLCNFSDNATSLPVAGKSDINRFHETPRTDDIIHTDVDTRLLSSPDIPTTPVCNIDQTEQLPSQASNASSSNCILNKTDGETIVDCQKSVNIASETDACSTQLESSVTKLEKKSSQSLRQDSSSSSSSSETNTKEKLEEIEKSSKTEPMETISISSDSRGDRSNSCTSSSTESRTSDSSSDNEYVQRKCKHKNSEKMDIDHSFNAEKKSADSNERSNIKNRRIFPSQPVSDVLIISDSSSDNTNNSSKGLQSEPSVHKEKSRLPCATKEPKSETPVRKSKMVDPNDCDWESLYDDSGECLVPSLMEELTTSVGRVRVTSVDSDYRPYQSIEERTSDGECVIEIYDFPAEFKTTDLFNIFAAYRNKNFQIKWVDDTHALGVFPSPLMADEVLACTLPFVKTRPLRMGIPESRSKAKNLVLPPLPSMERPKTCTALARRLVSGALGLRLPTSSQEREKEKQVLKEAREKRRLEAKQREAAWDGTLTSSSCI